MDTKKKWIQQHIHVPNVVAPTTNYSPPSTFTHVYLEVQLDSFLILFVLTLFSLFPLFLGWLFFCFRVRRRLCGVGIALGVGNVFGVDIAFGMIRVMPPLSLEVTHSRAITVVVMLYLDNGVCVGTYLP